eukprot:m51a1_g3453 hypothetical protein (386) ;mRNA; f:681892-683124
MARRPLKRLRDLCVDAVLAYKVANDRAFPVLLAHLPSQSAVSLMGCADLGDPSFRLLADKCGPVLDSLKLRGCAGLTSDALCRVARASPRLRVLNVAQCPEVDDAALKELAARCPMLQEVSVGSCYQVTNAGVCALSSCARVQALCVSSCQYLTEQAARSLAGAKTLTYLDVAHCTSMPAAALRELVASLPKLRVLVLEGCTQTTPEVIAQVGASCHEIEKLSISGCSLPPQPARAVAQCDPCIAAVAEGCKSLSMFHAAAVRGIGDAEVRKLAECCPSLFHIELQRCTRITDVAIVDLALRCPRLRAVHLDATKVTDKALGALSNCHVEVLSVSFCGGVQMQGILALISRCNTLRCLSMYGCPQLDRVAIREKAPRLRIMAGPL